MFICPHFFYPLAPTEWGWITCIYLSFILFSFIDRFIELSEFRQLIFYYINRVVASIVCMFIFPCLLVLNDIIFNIKFEVEILFSIHFQLKFLMP